jgi:hypothetical protein
MRSEGGELMRVGGREERLAVSRGDFARAPVQVEQSFVKMADLDRVETVDCLTNTNGGRWGRLVMSDK